MFLGERGPGSGVNLLVGGPRAQVILELLQDSWWMD